MDQLSFNILIVDDSPLIRQMLGGILANNESLKVDEAKDAETGLEMLRAKSYDIVFLDWRMPGMSGIDLVKIIRDDEALKDLIVLMITSETDKLKIVSALKAGVDNYILKPFSASVINAKMKWVTGSLMIGFYLVKRGAITKDQLQQALEAQKISGKMFGEVAIELKLLTPENVNKVLATQEEMKSGKMFGDLAAAMEMLSDDDVKKILKAQQNYAPKLGEILIKQGTLSEDELDKYLREFYQMKESQ